MTAILERYQTTDKKRANQCAKDATSRDDCIFIAPAHIFETLHNIHAHRYKDHCRNKLKGAKPNAIARDNILRYCHNYLTSVEQLGAALEFANNSERLAVHHYLHMGYRTGSKCADPANTFNMRNLIRGFCIYKKREGFSYVQSGFN